MSSSLLAVTFDCVDAESLAAFWAGVLNREVDAGAAVEFASIGFENPDATQPVWMFIKVAENASAKNRCHPDLGTADLPAETARIVALGASQHGSFEEGGHRWTTFTDPEGNVFDIVAV